MKRRSFIKILAAGILSPFLPSRSHSSEIASRDPALKPYPDTIILDQRRRPWKYRAEPSHLHDALQYAMMDHEYYAGSRWKSMQQMQSEVNRRRSLVLNKIVTDKKW